MSGQPKRRRGTVSRADLIDLLPEKKAELDSFAGIAGAFGFELSPEKIDAKSGQQNPPDSASNSIPLADNELQNGWTTFEPAPTQYWRVTGYQSKLSDQAASSRSL